ncbi:receptor-like serine/threonine-protein kinase SD1-8 isoform X2 [Asparagus officinalis]|uniref:receptor-like serine/threonine-protein kinase SD1-8 isoform X2 n=2 Tax=Asparagus officinalis TaxID=4686 RepID=UPI00098E140A|nr:receptor-like serine/threonine-protein kinase SD1-8 isoform X2 [Asparagus officinalis]
MSLEVNMNKKWPLFLLFFFFNLSTRSSSTDSITVKASISDGQTLISAGGDFELGFFTPGVSRNRYLGIWYKNIPVHTVVWVANRENPISDSISNLTMQNNGGLILQNATGSILWSTGSLNLTSPVAQLLDSGNFIVKDASYDSQKIAWQSFDYPTDTLLPGMKLGWNLKTNLDRYLTTWESNEDPSVGDYSFKLDLHGSPEFYIWNGLTKIYRNGPWTGYDFSGEPEMEYNNAFSFEFVSNEDEVYYTYKILNSSVISRFVLNQSMIQRYVWIDSQESWFLYWSMPRDRCDFYAQCGPYGVCNSNDSPVCNCLKGFVPKSPQNWNMRDGSGGCVRRTQLQCQNRDGFFKMSGLKLPDTSQATVNKSMSLDECRLNCLANCSCTAFANANISDGGSGCITWRGDLIDIREFEEDGQDLYIRLAASELDSGKGKSESKETVIIIIVIIAAVLLLLGFCGCCVLKKKLKRHSSRRARRMRSTRNLQLSFSSINTDQSPSNELDLPLFDLHTLLLATNNFSIANKLGEGGFGAVYKGKLGDGQFIAVKRLSEKSLQGLEEFKNEVMLIIKLQHINLVRLLGCCIQGEERMLIYEYMHNRSLDTIIFDKSKARLLNWQKRFNIVAGIARGLLYLHQDSRLRIIHRDLKASNILLDDEMNPKISDFGVARTFGDGTDEHTKRLVGTLGYMSPEYAMDGVFSIKSDVFSFGVLVLEIISGKKNKATCYAEPQLNLLSYAWKLWKEGKCLELLDESISSPDSIPEVVRCVQVGLLCVEERAEDRPDMSLVALMLGAKISLPQPKAPGFCTYRSSGDTEVSSSCTVNDITVTGIEDQ